uniref:Phosphatidylserine synthase n=1 Tax=Eimeria falciformis TaxID=84963 RepID=A0A221S608_9EIME|nr:phosphatidylserine synthase [Eimeria falciformis]
MDVRRRGPPRGEPLAEAGLCEREGASKRDMSKHRQRSIGIQTAVPSREYMGPRARATQAPEFFKSGWIHRPKTVSTLCVTLALIFVAAQIVSGQKITRRTRLAWGSLAALFIFLVFGTLQLPDGLLVRPSPIFWRFVKSCSVVYLVGLAFLLFQDLEDVRSWLNWLDPEAGLPLVERNYAEKCHSWAAVVDKLDIFVVAHFVGWMVKALVIRDSRLLWLLSILFEFMEISFRHILPNFWECWWDHLILDVFGCNLLGIYLGLALCKRMQMLQYNWHDKYAKSLMALGGSASRSFSFGYSSAPFSLSRSNSITPAVPPAAPAAAAASSSPICESPRDVQPTKQQHQQEQQQQHQQKPLQQQLQHRGEKPTSPISDALKQLLPYELTAYHWPSILESAKTFTGIVFFCIIVTLLDLNIFFLKAEFYIQSHHWIIVVRLILFSFAAAAGTREFYAYLTDSQCPRMGLQCWLDLAMISAETLLAFKCYFFENALQPHGPCPTWIIVCWVVACLLVLLTILYLLMFPLPHNGEFGSPSLGDGSPADSFLLEDASDCCSS